MSDKTRPYYYLINSNDHDKSLSNPSPDSTYPQINSYQYVKPTKNKYELVYVFARKRPERTFYCSGINAAGAGVRGG